MSICSFSLLGVVDNYPQIQQQLVLSDSLPWVSHVNRRDYQGHWDVLPLRCAAEHLHSHSILQSFMLQGDGQWLNLSVLEQFPGLLQFLTEWPCAIKAARLMRLHPGALIKPHCDPGLSMELGEARVHLCLQSNPDLHFYVADQRVPMQEGQIWYINADQMHWVENQGQQSRVNLVFDCVVNDWLKEKVYGRAEH